MAGLPRERHALSASLDNDNDKDTQVSSADS